MVNLSQGVNTFLVYQKHVYKDRKETTHIDVGEEKHTSSSYMKIKYNVCK